MKAIFAPIQLATEVEPMHGWPYLSWLAYPKQSDAPNRLKFIEASFALAFKSLGKHPPGGLQGIKRAKAERTVARGIGRAGKHQLAFWVLAKHMTSGVSINKACDLATRADGLIDYDPENSPDDLEEIWPNSLEQETPDKNVRRAYYEARPILPMLIALPIPPRGFRPPLFGELATESISRISLSQIWGTADWILPACRDAHSIARTLSGLDAYQSATIILPKPYVTSPSESPKTSIP